MRWINALERRFGHLAVPGLMRVVVAFNVLVYLLILVKPEFVLTLQLRPELVYKGQVWRLFSYIFIPSEQAGGSPMSVLLLFLYLNMLWLMGEGLEQAWGSFRLNLFYLVGLLGTAVAVCLLGANDATGIYLNTSLFLAFATLFPNFPLMLFFVIPVRVKWLALATFFFLMLTFIDSTLGMRAAIVASLANYLLFFAPAWLEHWREQGRTAKRQQQFQMAQHETEEEDVALHHCKVCGRTEVSSPELDFRVASDGEEYCTAHLPSRRGLVETPPPLPQER